jgi:hypothetical protein
MNTNKINMTAQGKTNKKQQRNKKQRQTNQFRLLTLKQEFLKISESAHIAFAVETYLAEGQWLEERVETHLAEGQWLEERVETYLAEGQWLEELVNLMRLRMFRGGTRRPAAVRTEGQHLVPVKTFVKNKASKS